MIVIIIILYMQLLQNIPNIAIIQLPKVWPKPIKENALSIYIIKTKAKCQLIYSPANIKQVTHLFKIKNIEIQ
ncbi:hypothetical protein DA717_06370 [Piscirickettsiaceae bacterium NZ-RLO2]|nr:hypothetical protein DA717_06370 [Piscirickettsiaceae bacterium NZ-RLO2]